MNSRLSLLQWFRTLSERERRILLIGAPLAAAMLLYLLLIKPLAGAYGERRAALADRLLTLDWLSEQAILVERSATACDPSIRLIESAQVAAGLQAQAQRSGISVQVRTGAAGGNHQISITRAPGDRVLGFVRNLGCAGLEIVQIELDIADPAAALVTGTLQLRLVGR